MTEKLIRTGIELLELEFGKERVQNGIDAIKKFDVEIPSWIFGDFGGGRFAGYLPPGAARNISEKLDDASLINKLTGAASHLATHVLWDMTDDGFTGSIKMAEQVFNLAMERGLKLGSISPTYFLRGSQRGSLSAIEKRTVDRYIEQTILAGKIAQQLGNRLLTLWLPDGSIYPGQVELRKAYAILKQSLTVIYPQIPSDVTILIEYKVFEPGTYSTVLSDWGSAYLLAKNLGPNVGVLVDLGHHHHGTNIEQIVARLVEEDMRCGFHFNTRYAADDDHAVESNPEMARIFYELVCGDVVVNQNPTQNWAYMIDQCSGRENRIHAILHSIDSLQLSLAKAMLVDQKRLADYQKKDEIILANRLFNDALLHADVRPMVAVARLEKNLPIDPIFAYVESRYQEKIEKERIRN